MGAGNCGMRGRRAILVMASLSNQRCIFGKLRGCGATIRTLTNCRKRTLDFRRCPAARIVPHATDMARGPAGSLLDQEVLDLLALGGIRGQPARLLAAAGPGFLRVGRVAVLRRHLASGGL